MKARYSIPVALFLSVLPTANSFSVPSKKIAENVVTPDVPRRFILRHAPFLFATLASAPALARQEEVTLVLMRPGDRIGVELFDVTIGTPPRSVVAVKSVGSSEELLPGMVLRSEGISTVSQLQQRIKSGEYPIVLTFKNLAAGGDAISDLGTPIVTAQDALELARQSSSPLASSQNDRSTYGTTILRKPETCNLESRRNDVLEIVYEAHLNGPTGKIYDSSATRGTGRPYQMVLGSGDMIPGVDLGLYNMCPGEVRGLQIPPAVAYGPRGNKLFQIPPNTPLYWQVELVSVQSIRESDPQTTRAELEGRY